MISLYSCKDPFVSFEEAQPQEVKLSISFPKEYIGTYYNSEENSELIISKFYLLKKYVIDDTISINELNKSEVLKGDSLYNLDSEDKYKITRINDTLFSNYIYKDTTFNIGNYNVLKNYKGYLFLNKYRVSGKFWEVEKIKLSNGILTISSIETETEIELLETITETKRDTMIPFRFKPTKKQFKEFIKKNGFSGKTIYFKI